MRGKLQIEWDLTFNSMYELFIFINISVLLYYNQSLAGSAIHKNNISNQMGVPIE